MNLFTSGFLSGMRQRMCLMLCAFLASVTFSTVSAQTQLAAWTFDATAAAPNTPTSVAANLGTQSGTATLYANGTNGSSIWSQSAELDAFGGTVLNDPRTTQVSGNAYTLKSSDANGQAITLVFSTTGFENPVVTFATRGTSSGFTTHQWAWSTDGVTFTDFGTNTANVTTTFATRSLDLSAINGVDNAANVYLRLTVTGATATSGNNRLDNIVINATAITGGPAPVVTGANLNGTAGVAFSHQVSATNSPSSYTVATGSLPAGLTLNSSTGLISGTPTVAGAFSADITASNGTVSAPATFNFTIAQGTQTIDFGLIPTMPVTDPPYTLTATASSGLTVTYTSSNPAVATVSGNVVTLIAPGTSVITAFQSGDANFTAATPVEQILTVLASATDVIYLAGGTTAAPANVPVGTSVSDLSAGNNFGSPALLGTGSASTGYTDASGGVNAGAAARTGAFNATTSAYFEFTITPDAGKQVTLFDIAFGSRSTSTGPQNFSIRTSIDNYATEIASGTMANNSTWELNDPITTATTAYPSIPVTYRIYGINGTGSATSGTVNWRIDDLTIRIMVDNMSACNGVIEAGVATAGLPGPFCETGSTTLSLAGNSNPATTLGVQLQWYSSTDNINFTPIDGATASTYNTGSITDTMYYYAVATCALSSSTDVSNTITLAVSEVPEISGDLVICTGGSTLLTATPAASYQWNFNGAAIPGATSQTYLAEAAGDYTVTTTTIAGCVLTSEVSTVVIAGTFAAPEVSGPVNVCPYEGTAEEVTYTITPQPGVTSYNWNVPPLVNLVSGQGTEQITVTFQSGFTARANKQIRVTGVTACGETPMTIYYLESHRPMAPGFISGPADACPYVGTATTATYSISPVIAATSYNWTVPAGATIVSHPAGTGINDTIIEVSFSPAYTTGYVSVEAVNNCGISLNPRNLEVVRNTPPTPGLISGVNNACVLMPTTGNPAGTTTEYTIRAVPGALSYNWTVPAGATIVSHPNGTGANDTTIVVSFSSSFTGGAITVSATDNCGTGLSRTFKVSASLNPASIGNISATAMQSCPDRQIQYSITMPANATWIQWTVPAGGTIVSGQGTNSILVSYTSGGINGNVTATASNGCATGSTRSMAVELFPCAPPSPFAKTGTFITGSEVELLEATVFPNPSATTFRLKVNNSVKEQLQVRVFDVQGKPLERFLMRGGETREFGQKMMPGVYFVEVLSGKERQVKQVTKL